LFLRPFYGIPTVAGVTFLSEAPILLMASLLLLTFELLLAFLILLALLMLLHAVHCGLPPVADFSTAVTNSFSITSVISVLLPAPYTNKS
jgi:hypothetical protein